MDSDLFDEEREAQRRAHRWEWLMQAAKWPLRDKLQWLEDASTLLWLLDERQKQLSALGKRQAGRPQGLSDIYEL